MILSRRGLIGGLLLACAAPAIVRASSLMDIKPLPAVPVIPTLNVGQWRPMVVTMQYKIVREENGVEKIEFGSCDWSAVPALPAPGQDGVIRTDLVLSGFAGS